MAEDKKKTVTEMRETVVNQPEVKLTSKPFPDTAPATPAVSATPAASVKTVVPATPVTPAKPLTQVTTPIIESDEDKPGVIEERVIGKVEPAAQPVMPAVSTIPAKPVKPEATVMQSASSVIPAASAVVPTAPATPAIPVESEPVMAPPVATAPVPPIEMNDDNNRAKKRGGGIGCGWLFSCRSITCLGCFLPLLLIIGAVLIIFYKPDPIWATLKDFANAGIQTSVDAAASTDSERDVVSIQDKINDAEVDSDGNITVSFNEEELATIFARSFRLENENYLDLSSDGIRVYVNLDETEEPLWFYLDLEDNEGSFSLVRAGFGRSQLPNQLVGYVDSAANRSLDFVNIETTNEFVEQLFEDDSIRIDDVTFTDDQIMLIINAS